MGDAFLASHCWMGIQWLQTPIYVRLSDLIFRIFYQGDWFAPNSVRHHFLWHTSPRGEWGGWVWVYDHRSWNLGFAEACRLRKTTGKDGQPYQLYLRQSSLIILNTQLKILAEVLANFLQFSLIGLKHSCAVKGRSIQNHLQLIHLIIEQLDSETALINFD